MELGVCGICYKTAGMSVRDQAAFTDSKKIELLEMLEQSGVSQALVLATCNRSEVYYFYEEEELCEEVEKAFAETFSKTNLSPYLHQLKGRQAMEYLFRVAAGLESPVLGEDQILGQLKEAYEFSKTMGYSGKELNRVIQDAIACAKKIKTELKISTLPLSVAYVGIRKLEEMCGIRGKNVLIVGSGQTAALALRYVYAYGAENITICNRTLSRVINLKQEFPDIHIGQFYQMYGIMKDCDIVISATSAPHTIIHEDQCMIQRETYFLDLASPRDIDIEIGNHPDCHIWNLDMLEEVVRDNQKEREALTEQSRELITTAVNETEQWLFASGVDPAIQSLKVKCDEIVEDSFEYLNRKIELSSKQQKLVKRTLQASFRRLFREPIEELKKLESKEEQEQYMDTLAKLFQI